MIWDVDLLQLHDWFSDIMQIVVTVDMDKRVNAINGCWAIQSLV